MSVSDGQPINQSITNSAFLSRKVNSDTIGKVTLNNTTDPDSGAQIDNVQRYVNEIADSDGTLGEGDAARKDYANTNFIADGDSRKTAIEKLDAQAFTDEGNLNTHIAATEAHGATGAVVGTTNSQVLSNKSFSTPTAFTDTTSSTDKDTGAIVVEGGVGIEENLNVGGNTRITGDLTVDGTTTTVNSTTLDVTDANITVNNNGDDVTAEGAGLTVERTGVDGSIAYEDALTSKFKIGALGSEVEVADVSSAQAFTNKDFSDPSNTFPGTTLAGDVTGSAASNTVTAIRNTSVPAPTALNDGQAIVYDDGTSSFIYGDAGGGSGVGGINYNPNPDAEKDATGYSLYADAADVRPVDMDGGSPVSTFVRATTPSEILRGDGTFKFSKDAANRQGEGFTIDAMTFDEADTTSVIKITFDYSTTAGYADGDARVYIYDVTGTQIIEPVPTELLAGGNQKFVSYFQTSTNTSYRVGVHVSSTSTNAYDILIDNFIVGPATRSFGPVMTDWVPFTPSFNNLTTSFSEAYYRRSGDSLEVSFYGAVTGAVSTISLNLPFGLQVDPSKIDVNPSLAVQTCGTAMGFNGSTNFAASTVTGLNNTSVNFRGPTGSLWTSNSPFVWGSGDSISGMFKVPIQGWSSSQQISDDADTRLVASKVTPSSSQSVASGVETALTNFTTVEYDKQNAFSGSIYTAPSSGVYTSKALINFSSNTSGARYVGFRITSATGSTDYIGPVTNASSSTSSFVSHNEEFELVKGDTVQLLAFQNSGSSLNIQAAGTGFFSVSKNQGPSQIAANELVACRYTSNSGQAVATNNILVYEDLVYDTHGSYNASTGVFTAPSSGKYSFKFHYSTNGVSAAVSNILSVNVRKNGSIQDNLVSDVASSTGVRIYAGNHTTDLDLNKGDTVDIQWNESLPAVSLQANSISNGLSVHRIGF